MFAAGFAALTTGSNGCVGRPSGVPSGNRWVSKRSVYNNFADKQTLFTELVLGYTATAEDFAGRLVADLPDATDATDVPDAVRDLALRHLQAVARPQVLRLR